MTTVAKKKQDPWPDMESQADVSMRNLTGNVARFRTQLQEADESAAAAAAPPGAPRPARTHQRSLSTQALPMAPSLDSQLTALDAEFDALSTEVSAMQIIVQKMVENPEQFTSIPSPEIQRRNDAVHVLMRKLGTLRVEIHGWLRRRDIRARQLAAASDPEVAAAQAAQGMTDQAISQAQETHRAIDVEHGVLIDRIAAGLQAVTDDLERIGNELDESEKQAQQIEKDMDSIQGKMDQAAKKLGKLMDETSDKSKIIIIVVLLIILGVLVIFVATGNQ